MVQLTKALCKYVPEWYHLQKSGSSYFRKQHLFFLTRFHKDMAWSQFRNAYNRYHYYLKGEMFYAAEISAAKRDVNRARIAAACEEHDFKYQYLKSTLPKLNINLNLSSLAHLAIYEPKTFKSLVDICKEYAGDPLEPANFNPDRL